MSPGAFPAITFLGTGAAGGTPGRGRSSRRESSALVESGRGSVLIDAPAGVEAQADLAALRAVLITHAHRDAVGGLQGLRRACRRLGAGPVRLLASPEALSVVAPSAGALDPLVPVPVQPGSRHRVADLGVGCVEVPHARERRFRTYAWRLRQGGVSVVYASDVARLEAPLARFSRGAELLIVDGAMWRRRLYTHLTIDRELPDLCRWPVGRILLTQIGSGAPAHATLAREVAAICPRAAPAYDGLRVELGAAPLP